MAINTKNDRKRAFDYGLPWARFPFPIGTINEQSRVHIWGAYILAFNPIPDSPYYIPDHTARTLALLIEQFKPAEILKGFISAFTDQLQITEDVIQDLMVRRLIETSIGVQLDGIGTIVGENREGRNDEPYRAAIYERIFINTSNGEPETMIRVLKFLTEATQVRYFEPHPAAVYMWTNGQTILSTLIAIMQSVAPIAIEDIQITSSYGIPLPFSFDGEGGIPFTEGLGFSEYNYTEGGEPVGGQLVEVIP